jgi:hypothetical protein
MDEVKIEPVTVNNVGLGKSIYTKEQLEEFSTFQDSQGSRRLTLQSLLSWHTWAGTRRESGA